MDAAGTLALVVLGVIIGWVIQLVVDFLILRPHWIAQGRQQASTVPDDELRASLREQSEALRAQNAMLSQLDALRAEETAALARLNAYLAELSERPDFVSDETLQHALAPVVTVLETQHDVLGRLEMLASQGAKSTDALGAQVGTILDQHLEKVRRLIEGGVLEHDRLTDISGIGPAYAGRLHEMGIHSFKQVAALTPEELATLMNVRGRPKIDAASWIEQAKLYVSGLAKTEETS